MDNRRYARPTSRDTRRATDSSDPAEPRGDDVELVELTAPSRDPRQLAPGTIWLAIVLVGLIGFGAGFAVSRGTPAEPSSTMPPVAAASNEPTGSPAIASIAAGPTPRVAPTPEPTRSPGPTEWVPYAMNLTTDTELMDLWTLDGQFVLPAKTYGPEGAASYVLLESTTGRTWVPTFVPTAIQELQAGNLIDGRLWFIARVEGVANSTVELVSTDGRGDWQTLGPSDGLDLDNGGATVLARASDRWVVSTWSYPCCGGEGDVALEIRTSPDGVHWSTSEAPASGQESIYASFTLGGTLGLAGVKGGDVEPSSFFLTTRNGKAWTRTDLPFETVGQIFDTACSETLCVGIGSRQELGVYLPTMVTWSKGSDWVLADGEGLPSLARITTTPFGFVGLDERATTAWLSSDGIEWHDVDVIVEAGGHYPFQLAVNDEYVAAVGVRDMGSTYISWAGNLAAPRP
ncbi:MAG TPA: hypothetical protein VM451_02795 [Candidatus Limnocylindria bacterium]|nr:hypothetical protein [Candidatus Limnocylindria bacterium]